MGAESHAIEQHIEEERARLSSTVDELEERARETLDWRSRFRANPKGGLLIALAAGMLASALFSRGEDADGPGPAPRVAPGTPNAAFQAAQTFMLGFLAREARKIAARREEKHAG